MKKQTMTANRSSIFMLGILFFLNIVFYAFSAEAQSQGAKKYATPLREIRPTLVKSEQKAWALYGQNVDYMDFEDIPFDQLPSEQIEVPRDIAWKLTPIQSRDLEQLSQKILGAATEKLDLEEKEFFSLSPAEAIKISVQLSKEILDLYPDNKDPDDNDGIEFENLEQMKLYALARTTRDSVEYYDKGVEDKIIGGKGDCDDFVDVALSAFRLMKTKNVQLKNIYVSNQDLGGTMVGHAYNSFVLFFKDKIIVTQLDGWTLQVRGSMFAEKGKHVSADNLQFKIDFYDALNDNKARMELRQVMLQRATKKEERKVRYLELVDLAMSIGDVEKIMLFQKQYFAEDLHKVAPAIDDTNLYRAWFDLKEDYLEEAKKFAKELYRRQPNESLYDQIKYFFPNLELKK